MGRGAEIRDRSVIIDTAVGPVMLDRTGTPASAHLTYRGDEYVFPEPYNSAPDLPVSPFLSGMAGAVVRALAAKASFVWHANDDVRLVLREVGEQVRVERTHELDRALEHLARSLLDEVRSDTMLREFEAITDDLARPVIWRAGHTRLHTHHTRAEQRREYLGKLAPLGGLSLNTILPELGYVEVAALPRVNVPEDFARVEWDRYMPSYRGRYEPSSAWVKPEYRAVSALVEQIAVVMEIPASQAATGFPSLGIEYEELEAVDAEFGFAFVAGLRLTYSGGTVTSVDEILDLEDPDIRRDLPEPLLRAIHERGGRTIRYLIPRAQRELARYTEGDDTLLRLVGHHAVADPSHAVTPERFTTFPSPAEHRTRSAYASSQRHRPNSLPSYVHPAFDEEAFRTAVLQYLQRDTVDAEHPVLKRAGALAEGARAELLPLLDQVIEEGAAAVRPVRDALVHAVDLLSSLRVEDLSRHPAREARRRTFAPEELVPPPARWYPIGSEDRKWEAVLLTFALNRAGEAVLVPAPLVAALTYRPEPVSLPLSWEWRVDAFRFATVAIARDTCAGQHVVGNVTVAGLDIRRGTHIAVVVTEHEWPRLVDAIAKSLGTTAGDPEKVLRHLRGSAALVENVPDAQALTFDYESWLPDLSNLPRVVVLERSPAIDINAEEREFARQAPRLHAALRRWSRLRAVFAEEFFLGGADVEWYSELQRFPLLTIPGEQAELAEEALGFEVTSRSILPLYIGSSAEPPEGGGSLTRAAAWLREVEGELRLEYGVWEVVGPVVVRIVGTVASEANASAEKLGYGYGYERSSVVLRPGRLPRNFDSTSGVHTVILQRSVPLSFERGPSIQKWGVSSATLLEAYREGGSYSQAARVLGAWGVKVSSGSIGTEIRRIQSENPALYAAVLGQ